jgi:superfamily II DNA/RNA helicase
VEELGHVVNFDVPMAPEDYIHRVGRTARADATGDAHTLVSPQEEEDLRRIETHLGKRLPRHTVEGFDYAKKPEGRFEVPLPERIAAIRARKAEERARAKANAERRAARQDARGNREQGGARAAKPQPHDRRGRPSRDGQPGWDGQPGRAAHHKDPKRRERPEKDAFAKPRQPQGFTFVRTSRIPDSPVTRPATDTSGVREDVHRSHKHEIGGLSHWGKAWRKQSEAQARQPSQEE